MRHNHAMRSWLLNAALIALIVRSAIEIRTKQVELNEIRETRSKLLAYAEGMQRIAIDSFSDLNHNLRDLNSTAGLTLAQVDKRLSDARVTLQQSAETVQASNDRRMEQTAKAIATIADSASDALQTVADKAPAPTTPPAVIVAPAVPVPPPVAVPAPVVPETQDVPEVKREKSRWKRFWHRVVHPFGRDD
jgi:hypothetical protein